MPSAQLVSAAYWRRRRSRELPWFDIAFAASAVSTVLPLTSAVVVTLTIAAAEFVRGHGAIPWSSLFEGLNLAIGAAIFGVLAAIGTAVLSALLLPPTAAVIGLFAGRVRITPVAAFSGGVILYSLTLPFTRLGHPDDVSLRPLLLGMRFLALTLGAVGVGYLAAVYEPIGRMQQSASHPERADEPTLQFRIRHLLALTTVMAIGLTIAQAAGALQPWLAAEVAILLGMLGVTLWPAIKLVDWRHRRLVEVLRQHEAEAASDSRST